MPKKRKNSGKNKSGKDGYVQCSKCGATVPRSKAKRVTRRVNLVDRAIAKELRAQGTIMPNVRRSSWYCVSCAVHTHKVKIREGSNRRKHGRL